MLNQLLWEEEIGIQELRIRMMNQNNKSINKNNLSKE